MARNATRPLFNRASRKWLRKRGGDAKLVLKDPKLLDAFAARAEKVADATGVRRQVMDGQRRDSMGRQRLGDGKLINLLFGFFERHPEIMDAILKAILGSLIPA